jgi:hypothetical protein
MEIPNNEIIYNIIYRYYNRFYNKKKNKYTLIYPKKEDLKILIVYFRNSIFSSDLNILKYMIVIHYQLKNDIDYRNNPNTYCLSLNIEDYNDLLIN